jgi:hypothetical protein
MHPGASKTKRATFAYQPHQILPPHNASTAVTGSPTVEQIEPGTF